MRGGGFAVLMKESAWLVSSGSTFASCLSLHNLTCGSESTSIYERPRHSYNMGGIVVITLLTGTISLVTILGNVMVLLSIKVNRHLRTINNYFIFSLACADLLIGIFSMNLYIVYMVKGFWPLGPQLCDFWLVVDYVVSNASVMNLLLICFDRYFCVTQPLTYPTRRTTLCAGLMIAAAWLLSLALWAPAILVWQNGPSGHAVPEDECYILLLSSPAMTLATTIPAFYLPVVVMTVLYARILLASRGSVKLESSCTVKPCCVRGSSSTSLVAEPETLQTLQHEDFEQRSSVQVQPVPMLNQEISSPTTEATRQDVAENSLPALSWKNSEMDCDLVKRNINDATRDPVMMQPGPATPFVISLVPINTPPAGSRTQVRRLARERRVTKTVLAVLLAFIITWTPHNVMVVIGTFCHHCIPDTIWTLGYWLCYINSTVNPACYALCNNTFRETFKQLLLCRYKSKCLPK